SQSRVRPARPTSVSKRALPGARRVDQAARTLNLLDLDGLDGWAASRRLKATYAPVTTASTRSRTASRTEIDEWGSQDIAKRHWYSPRRKYEAWDPAPA